MKTRISAITALGLALAVASVRGAGTPDSPAGVVPKATPTPVPPAVVTNAALPAVFTFADARPELRMPAQRPESVWLKELVKLARSGVEEPVLLSFVDSAGTFNLGAEQIIFLRDVGFSSDLISSMIVHDAEIISGQREVAASSLSLSSPALDVKFTKAEPAVQAPPPSDTIVAPMTADFPQEEFVESEPALDFSAESTARVAARNQELYPIREPYAVPVTEPLVLVNRAARTPNLVLVEMFR